MKLKTVEINGKQYAEIDTAGLPVYVHDDGKEIGFDAPLAIKKITELNGEAKNHRLAKEAAEEKLAKFAAIEDGSWCQGWIAHYSIYSQLRKFLRNI